MRALISGITGQIGSHLADFLLEKRVEVYGLVRRVSHDGLERIHHILPRIHLIQGDLADQASLDAAMKQIRPDYVMNLAAQSHVHVSWNQPELTANITGLGVLRMLEAVKKFAPEARFYQASSSEMFGKVQETPQNERTPFYPRSPYGCAKVFGYEITRNYRESYGMHACNGIHFNMEGPRRGEDFVTKKITKAAARIKLGKQQKLELGNLSARRDWIHVNDAIDAMWKIANQPKECLKDYVISSGQTHTIEEFLTIAFQHVGLKWQEYVIMNPAFLRPAEVDLLLGDSSLLQRDLKWKPRIDFQSLVTEMVEYDLSHEAIKGS